MSATQFLIVNKDREAAAIYAAYLTKGGAETLAVTTPVSVKIALNDWIKSGFLLLGQTPDDNVPAYATLGMLDHRKAHRLPVPHVVTTGGHYAQGVLLCLGDSMTEIMDRYAPKQFIDLLSKMVKTRTCYLPATEPVSAQHRKLTHS